MYSKKDIENAEKTRAQFVQDSGDNPDDPFLKILDRKIEEMRTGIVHPETYAVTAQNKLGTTTSIHIETRGFVSAAFIAGQVMPDHVLINVERVS